MFTYSIIFLPPVTVLEIVKIQHTLVLEITQNKLNTSCRFLTFPS